MMRSDKLSNLARANKTETENQPAKRGAVTFAPAGRVERRGASAVGGR